MKGCRSNYICHYPLPPWEKNIKLSISPSNTDISDFKEPKVRSFSLDNIICWVFKNAFFIKKTCCICKKIFFLLINKNLYFDDLYFLNNFALNLAEAEGRHTFAALPPAKCQSFLIMTSQLCSWVRHKL